MSVGDDRRSGYLRYLPEVLALGGEGISVEVLLRIAETILDRRGGGLEHTVDGVTHTHDGIEAVLDRLPLLFDPYRMPAGFLPWLAGWVGTELSPVWDDHQRRRAVATAVPALDGQGTFEGLLRSLEHYAVSAARPRIALDDGSRILFCTPTPGRLAPLHTLLAHGPFLRRGPAAPLDDDDPADDGPADDDPADELFRDDLPDEGRVAPVSDTGPVEVVYPGLTDPGCLAATPDGDLLLGESAIAPGTVRGLWRVSRTGAYVDTEGAPPTPRPLGRPRPTAEEPRPEAPLKGARALVVEVEGNGWHAFVLDVDALYRLSSGTPETLTQLATRAALGLASTGLSPLESDEMIVDAPARLLVVDRDALVAVNADAPATEAFRHPFRTEGLVPGPLVALGDHLVVVDLRSRDPQSTDARPADLVLVDRGDDPADPDTWTERRLLATLPAEANPLVTPVALTVDGPDSLLVLDLGLRPRTAREADPFVKARAEPASVYRVRLTGTADAATLAVAGIEEVTAPGRLNRPTGMVVLDGTVYVSDPGQAVDRDDASIVRNRPGFLGVSVHFSRQRPTDPDTALTRRRIAHDVASIIDHHKPASVVAARPQASTDT
ncbi:phage tail protein [Pseudonocardia charpentierae]|uniref:Phage tail protein n=1 Tax=Pseudonocardia charpentierae TaxID=3075545 RepID=A0ABU2NGP4_9PSEU|nr:phage tail protein [Pseudonocardia sp. DSM 45834]MDT0353137.1 phage tail protein [Pseudonocardia sp. DSM 45834]